MTESYPIPAAAPELTASSAPQIRRVAEALRKHGFGDSYFRHAAGHGVGLAAIDHTARPRLHPKSDDVLKEGMTCNVEPAVYVEGYGGIRHCDVVTVTADGMELLTPFQSTSDELAR